MYKNTIVLGLQWGDEGKGKVIDLLSGMVDIIIRFQGGHNAGHTIIVNQQKVVLRLVPSGIMHKNVHCMIGHGVALSLNALLDEIKTLKSHNIEIKNRFFISNLCNLIMPYHVEFDKARDSIEKIGTTGCGISPCYEDKIARRGIRLCDLFHEDIFASKLISNLEYYSANFYQIKKLEFNSIFNETLKEFYNVFSLISDVTEKIYKAQSDSKKIIFEGAQGSLLDIDIGTYPFVTSSNCTAGGAITGTGVNLRTIDYILGITKAYSTRVGLGPFPSELTDKYGKEMSERGNEFGSVTGRARRCGWLDIVALRTAIRFSGVSGICITKLDILDTFAEIKLCVAYKCEGVLYDYIPQTDLSLCEPIYETVVGWEESTYSITEYEKLPKNAKIYIARISELVEVDIDIVSTGPDRCHSIIINKVFQQ